MFLFFSFSVLLCEAQTFSTVFIYQFDTAIRNHQIRIYRNKSFCISNSLGLNCSRFLYFLFFIRCMLIIIIFVLYTDRLIFDYLNINWLLTNKCVHHILLISTTFPNFMNHIYSINQIKVAHKRLWQFWLFFLSLSFSFFLRKHFTEHLISVFSVFMRLVIFV